jgi:two-component system, OmpR family, phosphate regulon sensor histidine kinase PhoR
VRSPPANLQLRRAQLTLMLVALVPTVMMSVVGIVLLVVGSGSTTTVVAGVLVLTLTTTGITGYILGSVYLGKGASLVRVQNDFVSAVSHELRTPVTSIRLLLESLRDGRLADSDREQVLSLLARETDRLEQLVVRVLELSRLESGAHAYARDTVDVRELVDEAIAAFDAVTLSNPTAIEIDLEPGLVVIGDRPTLVRALLNLLTNAWKYTGERKRIAIESRSAGRWVELLVHDNGPGIAPDEHRAIYEQFRRGRAAHETGAAGVGLGLAFVRTIVRGQRGRLDFESGPGATTFRVRLRRAREPVAHHSALPEKATS